MRNRGVEIFMSNSYSAAPSLWEHDRKEAHHSTSRIENDDAKTPMEVDGNNEKNEKQAYVYTYITCIIFLVLLSARNFELSKCLVYFISYFSVPFYLIT